MSAGVAQRALVGVVEAIATEQTEVRDLLAAVTPGGCKLMLPDTAVTQQAKADQADAWSRALLPLLECARVRLLLSGTLERADGKGILWLPYRHGPRARTREVELDAPGWAVVGYSRAQALAERAVLPVTFGALDGEASWRDENGLALGPHRLPGLHPDETTRPVAVWHRLGILAVFSPGPPP